MTDTEDDAEPQSLTDIVHDLQVAMRSVNAKVAQLTKRGHRNPPLLILYASYDANTAMRFFTAVAATGNESRLHPAITKRCESDAFFISAASQTVTAVQDLRDWMSSADVEMQAENVDSLADKIRRYVTAARKLLEKHVTEVTRDNRMPEAQARAQAVIEMDRDQIDRRDNDRRQQLANRARGDEGLKHLGRHFEMLATEQGTWANWLRAITALLLLALAGVGIWVTTLLNASSNLLDELIIKLPIAVPLAVLVGYVGGQASVHAATARRAASLAVRLRTLREFVSDMDEEQANKVENRLSKIVFGRVDPLDAKLKDGPYEELKEILDKVGGIADKVIEKKTGD